MKRFAAALALSAAITVSCGGSHQSGSPSPTSIASRTSTTVDGAAAAYIQALEEPVSGLTTWNNNLDIACVGSTPIKNCQTWALGDESFLNGLIATVGRISAPSAYIAEHQRVLAALHDDLAHTTALVAACNAAPADANRQNDPSLDAAVSGAGDQSQLLAAMRAIDPNFSLTQ